MAALRPLLTLSVGVAAQVPGGDVGTEWILGHANQVLYAAKRLGRNRVISADAMLAEFAKQDRGNTGARVRAARR
jgi:hypothetical protein